MNIGVSIDVDIEGDDAIIKLHSMYDDVNADLSVEEAESLINKIQIAIRTIKKLKPNGGCNGT